MATIKLKTMVNINKETPKRILGFKKHKVTLKRTLYIINPLAELI